MNMLVVSNVYKQYYLTDFKENEISMIVKQQLIDEFCHNVICRKDYNQYRAGVLSWKKVA